MTDLNRTPLVSVIMPVYKVEEYIGRAIESIQAQTFKDWEMWAVDDGSPDASGAICDRYASGDPRIHVIHKKNGGAPSARNTAMERAAGKYFYFMDSDDWAEPGMLADMVSLAEKNDSQLVVMAFYIDTYYTDTGKYSEIRSQPDQVFAGQKDFRRNAYRLFDWNLLYTPWNKLYLAEYLKENRLYFPQIIWDDLPFNLSVVRDIERVCVGSTPYYHYIRKRTESETARYNPEMYEKRKEHHQWLLGLYRYWGIDDEPSREMVSRRYSECLVGCVENLTTARCTLSAVEKRRQIRQMIDDPLCREALRYARPRSLMMRVMLLPLKGRLVWLTYLEGKVISFVKSRNLRLFAALKANR